MTIADSRVVGQLTVRTGPFITITDFDYCGGLADGIYQIVPESLLAEAEAHSEMRRAAYASEVAKNAALQSRLDAVLALADSMEHDENDIRLGRQWMGVCKHYAPLIRSAVLGGATTVEGGDADST